MLFWKMFPFFTEANQQFSASAKSISLQQTTKICFKKTDYASFAQPNPYLVTAWIYTKLLNLDFIHQNACIALFKRSNAGIIRVMLTELLPTDLHLEGTYPWDTYQLRNPYSTSNYTQDTTLQLYSISYISTSFF